MLVNEQFTITTDELEGLLKSYSLEDLKAIEDVDKFIGLMGMAVLSIHIKMIAIHQGVLWLSSEKEVQATYNEWLHSVNFTEACEWLDSRVKSAKGQG